MQLAATLIIKNTLTGKFIGVTRRNSLQIGFPGGKADFGEGPLQTALRETLEETGLDVPRELILQKEFTRIVYGKDGKDFLTFAYYAELPVELLKLTPEPGLYVFEVCLEEFYNPDRSPFHDFNLEASKFFDLIEE